MGWFNHQLVCFDGFFFSDFLNIQKKTPRVKNLPRKNSRANLMKSNGSGQFLSFFLRNLVLVILDFFRWEIDALIRASAIE